MSEWRLGLAGQPFPASPRGSAPCRVLVLWAAVSHTPSQVRGRDAPGCPRPRGRICLIGSGSQHEEATVVAGPLSHTLQLCLRHQ